MKTKTIHLYYTKDLKWLWPAPGGLAKTVVHLKNIDLFRTVTNVDALAANCLEEVRERVTTAGYELIVHGPYCGKQTNQTTK